MQKNIILIILISFIIGLIISYSFFFFNLKKNDKVNMIIKIDKKNKQEILNNDTIIKFPYFIKKDLEEFGIDISKIKENDWKSFLKQNKQIYINNIEKNALPEILYTENHVGNNTILHALMVSKNISIDLIKKLISKGFDINVKNTFGVTPFLLAMSNINNLKDVKTLIFLGSDIYLKDLGDFDALDYAMMNKNPKIKEEIVNYLINEYDFSFEDVNHRIASASIRGNRKYLMDLLPKIQESDYEKNLGMLLLSNNIDDEIANFFLDKKLNFKKIPSFLPLLSDNINVSNKIIQTVLDAGVDINQKDSMGLTGLEIAISNEDIEKVELFLKNGAKIYGLEGEWGNAYELLERETSYMKLTKKSKNQIKNLLDRY